MSGRALALMLGWMLAGCSSQSTPLIVWYQPERMMMDAPGLMAADAERPQLVGSWDGFVPRSDFTFARGADGAMWRRWSVELPPGRYRYAFVIGGKWLPDPLVGPSEFIPQGADPYGREVSVVELPATAAAPLVDDSFGGGLVYQIMIDRFRGAQGALPAPAQPGDRAGGTLDGVRAAVEAGYFERLGVTTLWLSPLYQNPSGHHLGRDGRMYEAYHGYWPSQPRTVEPRLGGEAALDALVAAAHARGLKVVADAVPNHVHQTHPYFAAHPTSWFNDSCVCGATDCDWGAHIETCWFGPELPDLNWRNPDVAAAGADDLVWWMDRFHLDGLRLDAVPMMPRAASRKIAHAVRAKFSGALILGEDYTGPGAGGRSEIRAYLDQQLDGLDSAFDFPLMWAARRAIAQRDTTFGFDALEKEVAAGALAWKGSGATIAHMLDNHDTTRFSSEAAGDAGGDPWLAPAAQSSDPSVYARQLIGLSFMMTLPGLPVIYYGDEVALAGAGDPDSRRVLPDVLATLPPLQAQLLTATARLGRARQCKGISKAPRRVIFADGDHEVIQHGDFVVALSRANTAARLPVQISGRFVELFSGQMSEFSDAMDVAPVSAAVWLPAGDPCLEPSP